MVSLLLLLLLQSSQAPTRWPIEALAVEGAAAYSPTDILSYSGLKLGQNAGKVECEAARKRLMDSGYFGGAGYRFKPSPSGKGIAVTLEITEMAETYPVRFERLEAPAGELLACLKAGDPLFRDTIPASPVVLERSARSVEACLAARNKKVSVGGKLWPDRSNNLAVLFSPAARGPAIAQVQFSGSSVIPAEELQKAIAGVAIGATYTDADFQELLTASVRRLYDSHGRIRVEFPKVTTSPAEGIDGVAVLVTVVEGDVYTLGDVRLAGENLPTAQLLKDAAITDFAQIEPGLDRLKIGLHRSGYLKPEARVERVIREADKKADLIIHVDQGPQFLFGELVVKGLNLDGEAQLRRLWVLKPGTPFNADYPDYFLSRIREDGVFDRLGRTKAAVKLDDSSHTVEVTLLFSAQ